ncbi:MFS transporter [Aeromicrobium sp. A1-2]|uniref:MFS transporter n=1 Tax=Aeromicrobium sp. A1-2 TaxID=2107713 RepID=UPI000E53FA46|nr:MFS transporter [Aeromicrobium sp. A1-2]AXT84814.1 MFS transporter [Aeromicrobium sp. A1-2]
MITTYRAVLSRPGAALFSFTALWSRLPLSMAGLGIVLLVSERTGSYGRAGVVAAAYVLAAAALGPLQGRLADRLGQSRVLWAVGALYAVGIALTILAIDLDWSSPLPHLCAAVAGVATPQTGSMVRARWTHAVSDRSQLNTAFSIEAVIDEVVFVVGPVLVTFLTLQVADVSGLIFAGAAATLGSWALALQRGTAPPRIEQTGAPRIPIGWGLLGPLVAVSVGLGVLFGSTEVIVVAFTKEEGRPGAAGAVLAVWAAGSLLAGVVVGALPETRNPLRRFRIAVLVLALLFAPLGFLPSSLWLAAGLFFAGAMISPALISMVNLIELGVPPSRLTEALTWTGTGMAVGVAPGAAVAGWVVDGHGAAAGFLVPLVAGLAGAVVAWTIGKKTDRAAR